MSDDWEHLFAQAEAHLAARESRAPIRAPSDPANPSKADLLMPLKRYFGYSSFRPLQWEIIRDSLTGRDVFALLPTGGGKSLCFQLPALVRKGLTVVVSPLIALMKDQVDSLRSNGIRAACLSSSLAGDQRRSVWRDLHQGRIQILYVALGRARSDILTQLHLRNPATSVASFNRPNLTCRVLPKGQVCSQVVAFLRSRPNDSGIIYCASRNSTEARAPKLNADRIPSLAYHAGLENDVRSHNQERFLRDDVRVVCATVAFGMGINRPTCGL